jgi:hypothetical protein
MSNPTMPVDKFKCDNSKKLHGIEEASFKVFIGGRYWYLCQDCYESYIKDHPEKECKITYDSGDDIKDIVPIHVDRDFLRNRKPSHKKASTDDLISSKRELKKQAIIDSLQYF